MAETEAEAAAEADTASKTAKERASDFIGGLTPEEVALTMHAFKAALEGEDLKKGLIVHLTSEGSQRFEVLKQYE